MSALVDVREDYKSHAALRGDLAIQRALLDGLTGERYARAIGEIRILEINGQIVFNHMGGAKGDKLYKRAYAECVAEEKEIADRKAKQEARAKAREAASTHKKPEVMGNLSVPSASYAGRIRLRIKSHITFTDDGKDNPSVELEIHASPDGTIISRKILSRSGNNAWDDAVLMAIDKTASLPRY